MNRNELCPECGQTAAMHTRAGRSGPDRYCRPRGPDRYCRPRADQHIAAARAAVTAARTHPHHTNQAGEPDE